MNASKRLVSALAFAVVTAGSSGYAAATERERDTNNRHPEIVGMWITTYYVGPFNGPGTPVVDLAIQQFSSDGNELMNSQPFPPVVGNVCFGVWKALGHRTFKVRHIGWTYTTNNIFEGTARINVTLTVSANGDTYSGTHTTVVIDPNGNVLPGSAVEGDVRAVRFEVEETNAGDDARFMSEAHSFGSRSRRSGC